MKVDHSLGNVSGVSSETRASAEKFMVEQLKLAYQYFVRSMRKWNAMYMNSLGLKDKCTRSSIENDCNHFNPNQFRHEGPDTLARIASHIGNDKFGILFDRRSLSLLFIFLRHFKDNMIPDNK